MPNHAKRTLRLRWILAGVVLTFPIFLIFARLGMPGAGRAAWISSLVILTAIWARWELRRQMWFWEAIAVIVGLHMPLVLFVPWTGRWIPAFAIFPFGVADLVAILAILQWIEKRMAPRLTASTNGSAEH